MAGVFGLETDTWDSVVSVTKNKLGNIEVGDKRVFEKTTLRRFRALPAKEEELGKAVKRYVKVGQKDAQRMKDVADKVAQEDLIMADMFKQHMVRF